MWGTITGMQNSVSLTPDARALFNAAFKVGTALGRKFEAGDMTVALRQAARQYASQYSGDFAYMVEMRDAVAGSGAFLSDGQAKGVLNCLMADAKRRMADRAPKAVAEAATPARVYLSVVPDGRYRVTLADGDHLAVRINLAGKGSKLVGSRIVSTRINGDEWMGVAHVTEAGNLKLWRSLQGELLRRVIAAIDTLDSAETQDGWLIAGLAFAQEGSQCFFCGRDLDTPESLTVGYGPVCADKNGLPWGDKAIPMSVRLAQAAAAAPRATEPEPIVVPAAHTPKGYQEDPAITADRERMYAAQATARAEGRPRTYEDIFGDD